MTDAPIDPISVVIVALRGDPSSSASTSRVELDLSKFHTGRWALQLDAAFVLRKTPAVILAQGVACLAVAWWAQLSPRSYITSVRGAVFLSPLAIGFGQEGVAAAARLGPATRLPFPSIVAGAPYPFMDRLLALADNWGSRFVETGEEAVANPTNRRPPLDEPVSQLLTFLSMLRAGTHMAGGPFEPDNVCEIHP